MKAANNISAGVVTRGQRVGEWLKQAAFVLLLAIVACRPHLTELPFGTSLVQTVAAIEQSPPDERAYVTGDRIDLSRASFIVLIFLAATVWCLGAAIGAQLEGGWVGRPATALLAAFVALGFGACYHASDKYAAFLGYGEQVSLLLAGWLVLQMCGDRRRRAIVLVLLAGLAGAMATKGLWQWAVEAPQRVADFEANRAERLAQLGWTAGTAQAAMIEGRLRDTSPFGFLSLANAFASLMILLAAAAIGLAGDRLLAAARSYKARRAASRRGEIDLPLLAGLLMLVPAAGAIAALLLTGSLGAVAAAGAALAGAAIAWRFRGPLSRHWGKAVIVVALLFAAGLAGTVAYGLKHDRLPSKTMTFRWYYWTASAGIVVERPWWGVGPGNFGDAYMRHRRPAAEEEVKMPHNAIVHAMAQYGLPAGAAYLAIFAGVLIFATRPARRAGNSLPAEDVSCCTCTPVNWRRMLALIAFICLAVFAARVYFGVLVHPVLVLFDAAIPAAALGLFMLLGAWRGDGVLAGPGPVSRIALPAGLLAFALADMVNDALWIPGSAIIFWTVAGLCLSYAATRSARKWVSDRFGAVSVVLVAAMGFWLLTFRAQQFREGALAAYARGDTQLAGEKADGLFRAHPLSAQNAADAAELLARLPAPADRPNKYLHEAILPAMHAAWLDPGDYSYHKLVAEISARSIDNVKARYPKERGNYDLGSMAKAVELDPVSARLRVSYAKMLLKAGKQAEAMEQIERAEWLESQLNPESLKRFTPDERQEIEQLKQAAGAR